MLTKKQYELLIFIQRHLGEKGISPSFDEMKEALKLKSKSGIHRLITGLEERGFIHRLPHRARALEVVRIPENQAKGFQPNVIKGEFRPGMAGTAATSAREPVSLPLYGKIAAGAPIEALRDTQSLEVPAAILGKGEHFALEVAGDSMQEAGILDGDKVIVQRGEGAETGQIVVALIDENEVTLKRLRKRGASIALEPANKAYETRILPADRVRIQGTVIGLMRKY